MKILDKILTEVGRNKKKEKNTTNLQKVHAYQSLMQI